MQSSICTFTQQAHLLNRPSRKGLLNVYYTAESAEFCQWETFNATCGRDQLIMMTSARYGRMRFGRCMREDHGSVGCSADVLPYLDKLCSGRQSCQIVIPDATLHAIHPCPKELMPYLEASYSCVTTVSGSRHACSIFGGQPLKKTHGYLSSSTSPSQLPVGTRSCPWLIRAEPGQLINLTLFSFYIPDAEYPGKDEVPDSADGASGYPVSRCLPQRIVVQEKNRTVDLAVCRERKRERHLYTSEGNEINVYIHNNVVTRVQQPGSVLDQRSAASVNYLVKYQVNGCKDISVADHPNAWIRRHGDTAIVKCNFTGETYYLTCLDTEWRGELTVCSKVASMGSEPTNEKDQTYTQGILVVIGIGVALGVSLGIVILVAVLICLRRTKSDVGGAARDQLLHQSEIKYNMSPYVTNNEEEMRQNALALGTLCPYHQRLKTPITTLRPSDDCNSASYTTEILYESPKYGHLHGMRRNFDSTNSSHEMLLNSAATVASFQTFKPTSTLIRNNINSGMTNSWPDGGSVDNGADFDLIKPSKLEEKCRKQQINDSDVSKDEIIENRTVDSELIEN